MLLAINLLIVAVAAVAMLRSIVVVPADHAYVVERLGKYDRTLGPGLAVLVPVVDAVRFRHPTKPQTIHLDSPHQVTDDNVAVRHESIVTWKIVDPQRASYGVSEVAAAVREAALAAIRKEIGRSKLSAALSERAELERRATRTLRESCAPWGVEVGGCEIRAIEPPPDVVDEMRRQAERERAARMKS
jgi:regulator of protease activity HflC (stomatin/prohibitin superfamily)